MPQSKPKKNIQKLYTVVSIKILLHRPKKSKKCSKRGWIYHVNIFEHFFIFCPLWAGPHRIVFSVLTLEKKSKLAEIEKERKDKMKIISNNKVNNSNETSIKILLWCYCNTLSHLKMYIDTRFTIGQNISLAGISIPFLLFICFWIRFTKKLQ